MSVSRSASAPAGVRSGAEPWGGDFLERAEVRDVLAWMRLLVDPRDAAAVVRALARPPIELRQVELARVIQVARRRNLDLVAGLGAATESPQVPPEARERIQRFVELHRSTAAGLEELAPEAFIAALIERLGARGRALLAPEDAAAQRASLEQLRELACSFVRSSPGSSTRELVLHLARLVPHSRQEDRVVERLQVTATGAEGSPAATETGDALGATSGAALDPGSGAGEATAGQGERLPQPGAEVAGELELTLQLLREEVLDGVARIGGRLGELRLDTDLDISHGVVRYLELLKLAALVQRPTGQDIEEALADVNARLLAAATPLQREILQTSTLDDTLISAAGGAPSEQDDRARAEALAPRGEPSLGPFLPRKGIGLALSASDIETYRSCPLRYKFARVLRIPTEQTLHQRFGITVHQVLERYHSEGGTMLEQMLELLEAGWRRGGFGETERERWLREKARDALTRYHARLSSQDSEPAWFERAFAFRLGPHHLRGRVDRVDRLAAEDGEEQFELIDYKTSRAKTPDELKDDVQLSLYALAAKEAWQLASSRQAYYYVLDDRKVPVPRAERATDSVKDVVMEVGDGILAQRFEPTPSQAACAICDYRIVCPAAEG